METTRPRRESKKDDRQWQPGNPPMRDLSVLCASAGVGLFALLGGCAATIETGSHFDQTVAFEGYETFAWIDEHPYIGGDPALRPGGDVEARIQSEIARQLERLGYSYVEDRARADFVVAFTIGSREQLRTDSYPADFRGFPSWHVPGSFYVVRDTAVHSYTESTLSIDFFDIKSSRPVWHGWAQKTVTGADRRNPGPAIERGVRRMFENFPGETP
jgi:hypothetical protein